MKRLVFISDMHLEAGEEQHESYRTVKKFIKTEKPDTIIIIGDALDFSYLGSYNMSLEELRENKRLSADYDMFNKELDFFQKYSKEVIYLEGNHEYRLTRAIQRTPNFLSGLIELPVKLKLQERGIQYITEQDQPYKIQKLYVMHGKRYNMHFAKATLEDMGANTIMGHTHRIQMYSRRFTATGDEVACWGIGCLSSKAPEWQNGQANNWTNGFAYGMMNDRGFFNINNIHIVNGGFFLNKKEYNVA